MKPIIEALRTHGIVCKSLSEISPKTLGSRKRIALYIGVDLKGYYCSVMAVSKKSRVVRKEAEELMRLHEKMEVWNGTTIPKKYIRVDAPLCSKAKKRMEQEGWKFVTESSG